MSKGKRIQFRIHGIGTRQLTGPWPLIERGCTPKHRIIYTELTPNLTRRIFLVHLPYYGRTRAMIFPYHTISINALGDEASVLSLLNCAVQLRGINLN